MGPIASTDQDSADAASFLRSRGFGNVSCALVLGSGLGPFVSRLQDPISVDTRDVPGYPEATVVGHAGRIHFGKVVWDNLASDPLVVFQGRIHPYEGGRPSDSSLNVRIARHLGVKTLIVTNAAGGLKTGTPPGTIMYHSDIMCLPSRIAEPRKKIRSSNLIHSIPLAYSEFLQLKLEHTAAKISIPVRRGVYCYVTGPAYETPAEVRMLSLAGADAVGMSTYPEVSMAVGFGMDVLGVSLISNLASGLSEEALDHSDVTRVASEAGSAFGDLLAAFLASFHMQPA